MTRTLVAIVLSVLPSLVTAADPPARRWVYLQLNLQVADNVAKAKEILRRADETGYNGVVLADYKLSILDRVPDFYFRNAAEFKTAADELGIEVIPTVADVGYSNGLLSHDPNLAEGLPVRGATFVVRDGVAVLQSELKNPLPGGEFEEHKNNLVPGWSFQDAPGKLSFVDEQVKHSGKSSLRWQAPEKNAAQTGGNARVSRVVKVSPWRQYHASVWIKTQDYDAASAVRLFAMGKDGRELSFSNLGVKRTQDWTRHHVVFNSLDNDEVRIYCGTWGIRGGTLWMDGLTLEETAFVNLVRRPGAPLVVTGADGTTYEEGKDFAELHDPKMGSVPYAGSYEVWHEPPTLKVAPGSRIKDGDMLRIGFFHTVTIYDNQVTCCLAAPKVFDVIGDQVRRVNTLLAPKTWFLSHDEIRVANWCDACRKEGRTAGELLAENVGRCAAIVKKVDPDAKLCIWSDMFDPSHNARDKFYLVNGDLAGSWKGLPKGMTVVNWNSGKPKQSLSFFGERGHRQILAGFYDGDPKRIVEWQQAGADVPGVDGVMYTTWRGDFSKLEEFAKAAWGGK